MLAPDDEYRVRSMPEYGVHESLACVNDPLPNACQASSLAALPVTNIVDDNSNEVGSLEVLIISPSPPYHSPSPYHFT